MANHFVARVTGSPDRKGRAWQAWAVIVAPPEMTPERFHEILNEIHPEEYLFHGDYDELQWDHKHSGPKLIKAFRWRSETLFEIHSADQVDIAATSW